MSKKTDMFGNYRNPGICYQNYLSGGGTAKSWKALQKIFKRRKRLRRISRLMRKGQHPKASMRPKP